MMPEWSKGNDLRSFELCSHGFKPRSWQKFRNFVHGIIVSNFLAARNTFWMNYLHFGTGPNLGQSEGSGAVFDRRWLDILFKALRTATRDAEVGKGLGEASNEKCSAVAWSRQELEA